MFHASLTVLVIALIPGRAAGGTAIQDVRDGVHALGGVGWDDIEVPACDT